MGRRMGGGNRATPKALLDVGGEALIARLARQIRAADADADIHVVVGYRGAEVLAAVPGCTAHWNPFFDLTGVNASLWFARAAFDEALTVLAGDLVLEDRLLADWIRAPAPCLMAFDSSIRDPRELNVVAADGLIRRFGVNFANYSGAYAGMFRLDAAAARAFVESLDARIRRGFNEARTYYFFVFRELLGVRGVAVGAFDLVRYGWREVDRPDDLEAARRLVAGSAPGSGA
jgi:choline kinase